MATKPPTEGVLARAERLLAARAQRFTPVRRRVLAAVAGARRPQGAYDILAQLGSGGAKVAPPTVYRALDFLVAQGLVHRVHSRNAFVVCRGSDKPHSAALYICHGCGCVLEVPCRQLEGHVADHAREVGFAVEDVAIEVRGLCTDCVDVV